MTTTTTSTAIVFPLPPIKRGLPASRSPTLPRYAASCAASARYASACSCLGVRPTTVTAAEPRTTITRTVRTTGPVQTHTQTRTQTRTAATGTTRTTTVATATATAAPAEASSFYLVVSDGPLTGQVVGYTDSRVEGAVTFYYPSPVDPAGTTPPAPFFVTAATNSSLWADDKPGYRFFGPPDRTATNALVTTGDPTPFVHFEPYVCSLAVDLTVLCHLSANEVINTWCTCGEYLTLCLPGQGCNQDTVFFDLKAVPIVV